MPSFSGKHLNTHCFGDNPSLTESSTSLLHACKRKKKKKKKKIKKLKFLKKQNFYDFLKNRLFEKVTTDFENHAKRQAETKAFALLHGPQGYTLQSNFSPFFATPNFHPFRALPVWIQTKLSMTGYSWENNNSRKCYQKPLMIQKNRKLSNYRTSRFVYTAAGRKALAFPIACNRDYSVFRTLTFVPLSRFHC